MDIFDANTHIEKDPLSIRLKELNKRHGGADQGTITHYATVSDILTGMARNNVQKALVMPNTIPPDKEAAKKASEMVALEIGGYKNLVGAACVHPYSNKAVYDLEESILERGLSALMLCPDRQGFELDDEAVWILFERVEGMKIPVILHTQWSKKTQTYLDPEQLFDLGSSFRIDFILTHMGSGDNISPLSTLADLANIHFETSHTHPKNILRAIDIFGSERIIFGSDFFCNLYPKHELENLLGMDIEKSDKEKIFGKNLERLLK
jgi:predicted TIM-barrel fold metal-dependent hydrolase